MAAINRESPLKALVTDGHLEEALLVVRSLGRMGLEVHTTTYKPCNTLCSSFVSNHKAHLLPPPHTEGMFRRELLDLLEKERFDYLFPISDSTMRQISLNRGRIDEVVWVDLRFRRCQPSRIKFFKPQNGRNGRVK